MKRLTNLLTLVVMTCIVSGCYTTGLSMREIGNTNFSNFVYSLYDGQTPRNGVAQSLRTPLKLAVGQLGEHTPTKALINRLTKQNHLIENVTVIPAAGIESTYYNGRGTSNMHAFEKRIRKMRRLARDLGADYLFLIGGSVEYSSIANWTQFFDISIIGAFILPSNMIKATGRTAGVLIDVDSGGVMLTVNADAKNERHAATVFIYDQQEEAIIQLREQLINKLADNFLQDLEGASAAKRRSTVSKVLEYDSKAAEKFFTNL